MKKLAFVSVAIIFAISTISCSKKCDNEMPRARIVNNGTIKASVQIKTSNGSTVNINNVDPGTSSPYASYAAGTITFTISVNSINYEKTTTVANCYDYDIAIDAAGVITITTVDRNA